MWICRVCTAQAKDVCIIVMTYNGIKWPVVMKRATWYCLGCRIVTQWDKQRHGNFFRRNRYGCCCDCVILVPYNGIYTDTITCYESIVVVLAVVVTLKCHTIGFWCCYLLTSIYCVPFIWPSTYASCTHFPFNPKSLKYALVSVFIRQISSQLGNFFHWVARCVLMSSNGAPSASSVYQVATINVNNTNDDRWLVTDHLNRMICYLSVANITLCLKFNLSTVNSSYRKFQDYVYIELEYWSTMKKIKHYLRHENKVNENKGVSYYKALRCETIKLNKKSCFLLCQTYKPTIIPN